MANKMRPVHPGEILRDEINTIGLTANAFAGMLVVPANRITAIINGQRSITADTALRLARFFGTTPEFWLNLQLEYDLKTERLKKERLINKQVHPFDKAA